MDMVQTQASSVDKPIFAGPCSKRKETKETNNLNNKNKDTHSEVMPLAFVTKRWFQLPPRPSLGLNV